MGTDPERASFVQHYLKLFQRLLNAAKRLPQTDACRIGIHWARWEENPIAAGVGPAGSDEVADPMVWPVLQLQNRPNRPNSLQLH